MAGVGWRVAPFTLTVPPGAAPTAPRIVIGSDVPAGLAAYYATGFFNGQPETVIEAILFYGANGVPYEWDALVLNTTDAPIRAFGRFDPLSALPYHETYRLFGRDAIFQTDTSLSSQGNISVVSPGALNTYGKTLSGQGVTLSQAGVVGSRASATYANLPGNPSVTITKNHAAADTDLKCVYSIGGFTGTVGTTMRAAVNAGFGAAQGGQFFFNAANNHDTAYAISRLVGLPAGNYTINLQWSSLPGANTIQSDTGDWNTLDVMEVPVQ